MLEARPLPTQIQNTTAPARPFALDRGDALVAVLLFFTMLLGGWFRFTSLNWDDYVRFHPDERFLTNYVAPSINEGILIFTLTQSDPVLVTPEEQQAYLNTKRQACVERYPATGGVGGYFDTRCSDWNPHNIGHGDYVYGTLPLFLTRVVAETLNELSPVGSLWRGYWTDPNAIQLVWRGLSAIADMLVILLVFLIGAHLHSKWVGLVGAMLYAACVFPIQQAHFGTADAMSNLFVTLCIYAAVRVQTGNRLADYALFGVAYGMALASRINVLPIVGLLIVAAGLRVLPVFFVRLRGETGYAERDRSLTNVLSGLVLAGALTIVIFRLLNPYAFLGPGFFGLRPNPAFLDDLATAQRLVSGDAEGPPNYQWIGRVDYLFPWQNMVLWGMGVALGLSAWFGWAWSGWRVLRGRSGALRNLLLFGWVLVYFGWLGGNWVSTMRYFLPLYSTLTVLAAWALVELARPALQGRTRPLGAALLVGVVGFTILWAGMFTNIYRQMATFTQASLWVWEQIPGDFAMRLEGADETVPLLNVAMPNTPVYNPDTVPIENYLFENATRYEDGLTMTSTFRPSQDGTVLSIRAPHLGDILGDPEPETLQINITNLTTNAVVGTATLISDLPRTNHPLGDSYDILLDSPMQVSAADEYSFAVTVSGGPIVGGGSVMALESAWEEVMPAKVCTLPPGMTTNDNPPSGMFTAYDCNGRSVWDGLLNGYLFNTHDEDTEAKRSRMLTILQQTDYIMVPTNRRYDTHSRNPARWPLTNRFYDALFDGELNFSLLRTFQETFELGPLRISDQYLPTYDSPAWLNEFEAEEAFHVYDHPVVFIFEKNADYDHQQITQLLTNVSLNRSETASNSYNDPHIANISVLTSVQVDQSPTQLMMTDDMREAQYQGGTWSERFDSDSAINTNQALTVAVWWIVVSLFGLAAWPLLFVAFPGLADRGYGFAKFVGVLLVGWAAWVLATMRVPAWSQTGILLLLVGLAIISAVIVTRTRRDFFAYVRRRWTLLVWIEILAFAAFLLMVAIRLTNPDLWTSGYGGEKPMDFAYFNAVLRSTVFPPIDPWYAGGFLNYYYFGFVIVGTPTLLLGVIPSIAYNLILPMLFAMTGIAAFSCAFNVVAAGRGEKRKHDDETASVEETILEEPTPAKNSQRRLIGNPWVAGVMALLLAILLGNLDTIRVIANGVAVMGGYEIPQGYTWYLRERQEEAYRDANEGAEPDEATRLMIADQVQIGLNTGQYGFGDEVAYHVFKVTSLAEGLLNGAGRILNGDPLSVSPERWFWAPTRVISEIPEVQDSSIHEMPIFTYIYGDMHAHMIAMPLILFAVGFVFHELIQAGQDGRRAWRQFAALFLGALAVGLSKAVNTWDWPTLMILSAAGLGYAWWLRWERINRHSLLDMLVRMGGFFALTVLVVKPYDAFFATAYTELKVWEGANTPLWAYLDIHGLFLFLLVSLLLWETARWMRAVRVGALRGRAFLLLALLFAAIAVPLAGALLFFRGERIALVVLPLVAWIALLFFRPGQSRSMQFVLVLAGLSLSITLGTEFIVLANDNGRQNTIFKFYNQVWLFLSVMGGAAFAWLVSNSWRWRLRLSVIWYSVAAVLIFIALLFPIMATRGKAVFRLASNVPVTLDGLEYMRHGNYAEVVDRAFVNDQEQPVYASVSLPDEYNLIRWLQENIEGTPVIVEGQSFLLLYQWGGRIAHNTGLPTVIGWDHHQTQQRSIAPMPTLVRQRVANVNAFYSTLNISEAANFLQHYDVRYVIVGSFERGRYERSGGLAKFQQMVDAGMLTVVYEEGQSTVYEVNQAVVASTAVADASGIFNLQTGN
ncbi:MAG: DUF2298 domain-containing protein [bacterium]|nr:DUF2298 domain-containing protein [bacterium]